LDECTERDGTRNKLIKELQFPTNLHLLCTSRNHGDIAESFAGASRLEIRASTADMKKYLQVRIKEEAHLAGFCQEDKSLQGTIIDKLIEKADGMYVCLISYALHL
jgi:hypothetical protein